MTMTNTIPNVPRELLRDIETHLDNIAEFDPTYAPDTVPLNTSAELLIPLRALLSAPSPAGVDGLEVVGWYRMDDRKAITPYPSVCATWHKMGVKVGAAYSDSAQSTVDGLRYEIDRLIRESSKANPNYHLKLQIECDRSAKRIGELEGLLREVHGWIDESARVYRHNSTSVMLYRIDAALSAGKEGE